MALSVEQIGLVVDELQPAIQGGRLRQVWCRDEWTLVLELRRPGRNEFVVLSLHPAGSGIYAVEHKTLQPPEPPAFVMLARKHLGGGVLRRIAQMAGRPGELAERIVRLDFDVYREDEDGHGSVSVRSLVAELFGRRGALVLLEDDAIVGTLVRGFVGDRLRVGQTYLRPEPRTSNSSRPSDPLELAALDPDGSRSRAVAAALGEAAAAHDAKTAVAELRRRVKQARNKARRLVGSLERERDRALDGDKQLRCGQLLQSAYGKVSRGETSTTVVDYFHMAEDGTVPSVEIPLDPRKDLSENIEHYFRLAKKAERALPIVEERLEQARSRLDQLTSLLHEIDALPLDEEGVDAARNLVEGAEKARLLPRRRQRKKAKAKDRKRRPYHEFVSRSGKTILVGRGGRDNDAVSLKVARGNDLWLHTHNYAGAHVVVRLSRNEEPDQVTLEDAALLAVHYSKAREQTVADVLVTRAKYVTKPKGYPAGQVSVAGGKGVAVKRDPERLQQLLASRITEF